MSSEDIDWLKQMYDAEIRQLDDELARFFAYMEESGLMENTLVIVTSDHGEEFFEHGGPLHGRTYFQEVLAIPLILRGPGIPAGRRFSDPVGLVDVVPTILGVLGLGRTNRMDGIDQTAFWRAPESLPPLQLYTTFYTTFIQPLYNLYTTL